jgi:hypothetical protein
MPSEAELEAVGVIAAGLSFLKASCADAKSTIALFTDILANTQVTDVKTKWNPDNATLKVEQKSWAVEIPLADVIAILNTEITKAYIAAGFKTAGRGGLMFMYLDHEGKPTFGSAALYELGPTTTTTTTAATAKPSSTHSKSPTSVPAKKKEQTARFTTAPIAVVPPEAPNGKLYDTNVFAAVKVAKYLENTVNSHEEMTYHTYDKLLKDLGRADPLGEFTLGARGCDRKEGALNRLLLDFLGITLAEARLIARTKQTYQSFKNANRIMVASREEMSKKNLKIITPPESLSSSELPSYESVSPARVPIPTSYETSEAREAREEYAREVEREQEFLRELDRRMPRGAVPE